jgi:diacylglycerol kinase family enzyme
LITAVAAVAAARVAFTIHTRLLPATPPAHPVLIFNPRSGGGKAARFHLADEARRRGIEPVELTPGAARESLVDAALAGGADAIAMAGGDGSQAIAAAAAARANVPYACIPAGTRNHFALDLGVDRDDVVGALDAFVDGGERRVDLAEVNGRVFVNNVSLGFYADAVQHAGYREAKLRTLLETLPEVAGPQATTAPLRWRSPDGISHQAGLALLISNNPYRLGRAVASGTRPRLNGSRLGVAVIGRRRDAGHPGREDGAGRGLVRTWSVPTLEVDSHAPVPAGIDGEAAVLDPPLRFATRPGVLRVRIATKHPGCSPSAALPEGSWAVPGALARIAFTRSG